MLQSIVCRQEHFRSVWYDHWMTKMAFTPAPQSQHLHRKFWEWSVIAQALNERGVLRHGKRGLGFAVGSEPLVSLFASMGAQIDATDLYAGSTADFWKSGDQYAVSKEKLHRPNIIDYETFDRRVNFYNADMNDLSQFEPRSYDFIWSSCAVEHVGSLDLAEKFIQGAASLLKPGGVACHTTEFRISGPSDTWELLGDNIEPTVMFGERELREIDAHLRLKKCCIEDMDLNPGSEEFDVVYDEMPFPDGAKHIKLMLEGFVMTSVVLICRNFNP